MYLSIYLEFIPLGSFTSLGIIEGIIINTNVTQTGNKGHKKVRQRLFTNEMISFSSSTLFLSGTMIN